MKLKKLHEIFQQELQQLYEITEVNSFFFALTEEYLSVNRIQLALQPDLDIGTAEYDKMNLALNQLKKEKPLQYILGKAYFYGMEFWVNNSTLIPRPETEELVEWIVKTYGAVENKQVQLLDIGTGSGCIAISVAKHLPNAKVYAVDISEAALEVAKHNAANNEVTIEFLKLDILQEDLVSLFGGGFFDAIISNPPYVRDLEKAEMKNNVLNFEPETALFVADDNPLLFYSRIAELGKESLVSGGNLFFEINQYLPDETERMLLELGYTRTELKKDLQQNYRMLKAVNP